MRHTNRKFGLLLILSFVFFSCIGIETDINIRENGSGTINLDYKIHRMLESMGKMDGNERWLPVPVGQVDFERSVSAIDGLVLESYSQEVDEQNITVRAELNFSTLKALQDFLDASGRTARIKSENGTQSMTLQLTEGGGILDPDLETLIVNLFADYDFILKVQVPGTPELDFGESSPAGIVSVQEGQAAYSVPIVDILRSEQEIQLNLSW